MFKNYVMMFTKYGKSKKKKIMRYKNIIFSKHVGKRL